MSRDWNGYGWDFLLARDNMLPDPAGGLIDCDGDGSGDVSFNEAFMCIEALNSDGDPDGFSNLDEIEFGEGTQPGWTNGPNNTIFSDNPPSVTPGQTPPTNIGPLDPGGAGGTGGTGGTGGAGGDCTPDHDPIPPGQFKRGTIVVKPGQSIQEAIDRAQPGTRIFVHGGIYEEPCNPTNALNITKSGIRLVGQSNKNKRVIIRKTGDQRNGIVIRPPDVPAAMQPDRPGEEPLKSTDCMGCHTDMGPPFPLLPDVPNVMPTEEDPWIYHIEVRSITIQGFRNNGLNTEHVDGFVFDDVESIDNRNYGIFPVLSKNGVITNSYSTGSDLDSALWVETSENVLVQGNVVENSTNGIEVSNSDDVLIIDNEMRNNTIGAAILLLPDIWNNRNGLKRVDIRNNWIHDNNNPNGAREDSILGFFPPGIGILHAGADDSLISGNLVEHNDFIGIAIADYCGALSQTQFACPNEPNDDFPLGFLLDQAAENNSVIGNVLVNNATNPDPDPDNPNPFAFAAADLSLLTVPPPLPPFHGNCYENNEPEDASFFSLFDFVTGQPQPPPPPCL